MALSFKYFSPFQFSYIKAGQAELQSPRARGCWGRGLKGADWEMLRQEGSGVAQSLGWVHNFPSTSQADTNGLRLQLNLEWSTSNGRFGDAPSQPFAVLHHDLLVKPAPRQIFLVQLDAAVALALILFVICLNLYFLLFILLSILYNMGHCGKHSKISFLPLKPESLMTVWVFLFVYLFGFF